LFHNFYDGLCLTIICDDKIGPRVNWRASIVHVFSPFRAVKRSVNSVLPKISVIVTVVWAACGASNLMFIASMMLQDGVIQKRKKSICGWMN
jgi:hypothetical protein